MLMSFENHIKSCKAYQNPPLLLQVNFMMVFISVDDGVIQCLMNLVLDVLSKIVTKNSQLIPLGFIYNQQICKHAGCKILKLICLCDSFEFYTIECKNTVVNFTRWFVLNLSFIRIGIQLFNQT